MLRLTIAAAIALSTIRIILVGYDEPPGWQSSFEAIAHLYIGLCAGAWLTYRIAKRKMSLNKEARDNWDAMHKTLLLCILVPSLIEVVCAVIKFAPKIISWLTS